MRLDSLMVNTIFSILVQRKVFALFRFINSAGGNMETMLTNGFLLARYVDVGGVTRKGP